MTGTAVVLGTLGVLAAPAEAALPRHGYDISFPQCGGAYPANPGFGIVGVGGGRAFTTNPCLASEYRWAASATAPGLAAFYMNTGNPGTAGSHWLDPGPRACSGASNDRGCAYNYGWNTAAHAFAYASSQAGASAATSHGWWLDVETANSWSADTSLNTVTIKAARAYLRSKNVKYVGVYSTAYQWGVITGGARIGGPAWAAGAPSAADAPSRCGTGFTGGSVKFVQYPSGGYDGDYRC